ncbi:MAG: dihydroorotase, partial [Aurantibacter sp.]
DLRNAGAVAFTDGTEPIWHTDIFAKALLYLQKFNGLLINRPEDKLLTNYGGMNEGIYSTQLGMRGMPSIAEELMIDRDLRLLRYSGGRLHLAGLSTAKSVDMVREAKKEGLDISCDVAVHQLIFDHSMLKDFDTNYKVNPPFRSKDDIQALLNGLADDTIDVIVSDHQPHEEECKKLEFDQAAFGIIGLQTLLPLINRVTSEVPMEKFMHKLTRAPRELLNMTVPEIKEGNEANLTLFDPEKVWTYEQSTNFSKSSNSPLLGTELKGKVLAVFNRGKHWMDQTLQPAD